jgi:hypothetical protein
MEALLPVARAAIMGIRPKFQATPFPALLKASFAHAANSLEPVFLEGQNQT